MPADVGWVFSSQTVSRSGIPPSASGPSAARRPQRGVGEERLQPVVVGLENRIELVIVAAGAAEASGPVKTRATVGHVIQSLLPSLQQVRALLSSGSAG